MLFMCVLGIKAQKEAHNPAGDAAWANKWAQMILSGRIQSGRIRSFTETTNKRDKYFIYILPSKLLKL